MKTIRLFILTTFFVCTPFFAPAHAQTSSVEKVFNTVKERVDDLVVAKDANNPRELEIRIETFAKVIDLSETEAKELKVKLLKLELEGVSLTDWKALMLVRINEAITYYQAERDKLISENAVITLDSIKETAENFKTWRGEHYLPIAEETHNLLVISQERDAIDTAYARLQKVGADIVKLQNAKVRGIEALPVLFAQAKKFIVKADELNTTAYDVFIKAILPTPPQSETDTVTKETTPSPEGTVTLQTIEEQSRETAEEEISRSPALAPSIKDLVRSSLLNIRDAYQVFIEMSNVVRTLFN